ncbi:MAG: hypothetical protein JWR89_2226 [Tardiphaga sp.]|uniref:hypothetical protein n=1 Tax=Tardiphaga sp. TaxID=1926292 RepID=UPI002612E6E9|nr:hypothetical protein [Tardiphaga sp.]MDB5502324.1 hypothetical protein [Tardiphaga sp.]
MFLRGFRLFTTGRKNHNDLHRGVTPLWRPHDQPSFDFGGRYGSLIKHPQTYWTITDPRDDRHSAAVVLEQIMPFVSEFEGIQTVASFLDYFDFMRTNMTVPVQLDFALADYLAGDMQGCETALWHVESVLADHDESWFVSYRPIVARIRQQLDQEPAGLSIQIRHWHRENIARLGLTVSH